MITALKASLGLAILVVGLGATSRAMAAEPEDSLPAKRSSLFVGEEKLVGRVVLASDPEQGVADAKVSSYPMESSAGFVRATTDADGRFGGRALKAKSLIGAISKDGSLGGIARIDADQRKVTIKLTPTVEVRGSIWDEDTRALAAEREVAVHIRVESEDGMFTHGFEQLAKTDAKGRFEVTGIVPGYNYDVAVVTRHDAEGRAVAWRNVHSFKADGPRALDLGRMLMPKPYREPTIEERIATAYNVDGSPDERLEQAVLDAELNYLQVLIFVADPKSDAAREFVELRYNYDGSLEKMHAAVAEHRVMFIDPAKAPDLVKKLNIAPLGEDDAALAIVDGEAKVIDRTTVDMLSKSGKLKPELLTKFLSKHQLKLPNAAENLKHALQQAIEEDKRVLVQVSGPGCGWCVVLARYLHEQKSLIEKDYVWLKLDSRMGKADEVINKLRKDRTGGIPWMTILDAHGAELITSDSEKDGNIGYPGEGSSRAHWESMLRASRQRLTDDDVTALLKPLEEFARNREK